MAEVEGLRECLGNMKQYASKLKKATKNSLKQGGLFLQREAQINTPVDTGVLKNSAYTRAHGDAEVQVGFKTPYAVYVHEMTNIHHDVGKAKFLTETLEDNKREIVGIIANEVNKVKP